MRLKHIPPLAKLVCGIATDLCCPENSFVPNLVVEAAAGLSWQFILDVGVRPP